jgi:hypothetical protein
LRIFSAIKIGIIGSGNMGRSQGLKNRIPDLTAFLERLSKAIAYVDSAAEA